MIWRQQILICDLSKICVIGHFQCLSGYGLSASQAFKLFLTQVAETNKIPLSFDYAETENVPNSVTRKALTEAKNRTDFSDAYETPEEFMKAMQELANA